MRFLICFFLAFSVAWMSPARALAQRVYRIGALVADDQFVPAFEGFKHKMAAIGYIEGKNVQYDFHNAKGDRGTLKKLAQKLVQDKPDLIVTSSTTATAPVAKATEGTNLPVVFLSAGKTTGISTSSIDLTGKRLELLKE